MAGRANGGSWDSFVRVAEVTLTHDVFVSYSHLQREIADQSCAALEASGVRCWIAPRDVLPGEGYPEQIAAAIGAARACLLIFSSSANSSRQVQSEIELAFSGGIPILPFRIEAVAPEGNLQYLLAGTHWLEATVDPPARLAELVEKTQLILQRYARTSGSAEPAAPRNAIPEERTNLPFNLTTLIGRDPDLAAVRALLGDSRLVTLVGAGGVGKTKLAQAVGADLLEAFSDGVWFVDLAPVTDPAFVPKVLLEALRIREVPNEAAVTTLVRTLRLSSLLLIVDNCEHLIDAAAQLTEALLLACPQVRVLATSRQALGIGGEEALRLRSLSTADAVGLFELRARSANKGFALSEDNRSLVADICRQLDGIPLAIELAAARVKSLSVAALHERLNERFGVLTGGSRTARPRQQTLAALIDWSYQLLSDAEKTLFDRLGIFAGGFTLDQAGAVCAGEGIDPVDVPDIVTSLADKSLVSLDGGAESERYRLLESMRAYAMRRLRGRGEDAIVFERLVAHVRTYAQTAGREAEAGSASWVRRIEADIDQIRAVLEVIVGQGRDVGAGADILDALRLFWLDSGKYSEAYSWFSTIIERTTESRDTGPRGIALLGAGSMKLYLDAFVEARTLLDEAAGLFRERGDRERLARALNGLGVAANYLGDPEAAQRLFALCLKQYRDLGHELGIASSLLNLGATAQQYDADGSAAEAYFAECLPVARNIGNTSMVARVLGLLCETRRDRGDIEKAIELGEEALALWRSLNNASYVAESLRSLATCYLSLDKHGVARALLTEATQMLVDLEESAELALAFTAFAAILNAEGQPEEAGQLIGYSDRLRLSAERKPSRYEQVLRKTLMDELNATVGEAASEAHVARGRTLSEVQVAGLCRIELRKRVAVK